MTVVLAVVAPAAGDEPVWTTKPVRVDPAKQNYERRPGLQLGLEGGEPVSFPVQIDMHDSASFSSAGVEFVLKDLQPIARDRLCTSEIGMRWACGAEARIFVANLLRGRTFICKVERSPERVVLSGCRNSRMDIPFEIVARGLAFPKTDLADLEAALMKAKTLRLGVWKDAACMGAQQRC